MNISKDGDDQKNKNGMSPATIAIISAVITAVILAIIFSILLMNGCNPAKSLFGGDQVATVETTANVEWTGPTIPNYVGKTYDQVLKETEGKDITIFRNYADEYSDDYKEGIVMAQSPEAGSKITQPENVIVSVTIGKGPKMRELPAIEGLTLDQASQAIGDQGLLATAEYQYSDKYAEGRVIGYKSQQKGDTVEYGTNVILIVSKGTEPRDSSNNN